MSACSLSASRCTCASKRPTRRLPRNLKKGQLLKIPIKHGEGCYFADAETLERMRKNRQILLRYVDAKGKATAAANPNGSLGKHRRRLQ